MTIVDGNELELLSKSKLSIYVFGALTPNYKKGLNSRMKTVIIASIPVKCWGNGLAKLTARL